MSVRRFGPIRGAGTRVEERSGGGSITPGALGWAGYAGLFARGPVNEMVLCSTKTEFQQIFGGIIEDSMATDCAEDYYNLANGAGGIAVVRVTDGNELPAEIELHARRVGAEAAVMGRLKAKNGGRWGGKAVKFTSELDDAGDLDEVTLQLGGDVADTFHTNQLVGGYIELAAVANKRYPITGNTAAGLVTVASDQTMATDHNGDPDLRFYIVLENDEQALSVVVDDGEENGDGEFSLAVYLDGGLVKKWGNLHTDPNNARYWVEIINKDDANHYVEAVDLWEGAHTASLRPANVYGEVAAVTALTLTAKLYIFDIASGAGGDPTLALGTTTDAHEAQTITVTMSSATEGDAVSDRFGALGTVTLGALFTPDVKWAPPFTITAGSTALENGDVLTIRYRPLPLGLANGLLFPNKPNEKRTRMRIVSNTHAVVTVAPGVDLTEIAEEDDQFMIVAPLEFSGGRDGNDVVDADFEQAWDTETSPFNRVVGQNLGLVKFATPGVNSTGVQKAGINYASAKNHQYRCEIPSNITTDQGALAYVNDTVGRSDYAVWSFPSYGEVPHPDPAAAREGRLKTIPLTGMIHGREARMAVDFEGYHRAEAGTIATLPRVRRLTTGDRALNEELLNPSGINVIRRSGGNFVLWGDRVAALDPSWKWKHQREQMSYYGNVLRENFDFIIFSINDSESDADAATALMAFFRPEWTKRALRGAKFQDAAIIKVDEELNTDATRDSGDKIAEVSLRLADTTERFVIRIGKQGIFEQVA